MISWDELSPPAGCEPILEFSLGTDTVKPENTAIQPVFQIQALDFSKDENQSTGTGTLTMFYDITDKAKFQALKQGYQFLLKTGWKSPTHNIVKEFISGVLGEPEVKGEVITLNIYDNGYMLDVKATVTYSNMKRSAIISAIIKQAGLIPYIKFGDVKDDVISYTSASTSGSSATADTAGCVHHQGTHQGGGPSPNGQSGDISWENNCYSTTCKGKTPGTLEWSPKNASYDEWTCSKCSTDYDCMTGKSKTTPPGADGSLKPCSGASATSGAATASADPSTSSGDPAVTDSSAADSTSTSTQSSKSYWDMLMELTQVAVADLQVFVWMDTCYVQAVPKKETVTLQCDETKNIMYDTIDMKEGDTTIQNEVIVTYGKGNAAKQAIAMEPVLEEIYGPITTPIPTTAGTDTTADSGGDSSLSTYTAPLSPGKKLKVTKITKSNFNEVEAQAYADNTLAKIMRDSKFSIDLSLIGNPEYFICRWIKTTSPQYNIDNTYYIDKVDHKFDLNNGFITDLTLLEYRPTITTAATTTSTASSTDPKGLDAIMQAEGKFRDVQGVCSAAACLQSTGRGDCWADSYWLFAKLSAAGIKCRIMKCGEHRFIQINTTGTWVEYDYAKYANPTAPHGGSNRCHVAASVFKTFG
jgi:hypothetical protein